MKSRQSLSRYFSEEMHRYIAEHNHKPICAVISGKFFDRPASLEGISLAYDPHLSPAQMIFFNNSKHFNRYVAQIPSTS